MTPRQKELVWAFGVILVIVAIWGGWAHPESDAWFLFMVAVCGPTFLYLGFRTLFDKEYAERTTERALKMAAKHDKNFDIEKQRKYAQHPINKWSQRIFAMRGLYLGFIMMLILIGAITSRFSAERTSSIYSGKTPEYCGKLEPEIMESEQRHACYTSIYKEFPIREVCPHLYYAEAVKCWDLCRAAGNSNCLDIER